MIIAGIDEAGLGPVLGPLVVTTVAMSVPQEHSNASLWDLLAPVVSRKPSRRRRKIAIGDSKKLYNRSSKAGLEHLERAVLGMLTTGCSECHTLQELLKIIAPGSVSELERYPWYAAADLPLPRSISKQEVVFAGNALAAVMEQAEVRLKAIRCEPVLVGEFNRIVQATRNKSTALFDVTSRLLMYLWQKTDGPMRIYIDRHGGRKHYLPALQRVFADCHFKVLEESENLSGYLLTSSSREVEVYFTVNGEQQKLTVALASMVSKYVRELFMELFNGFWQPHVPQLAPTAGYYTDGKRFFGQIQPAMKQLGIGKELLYRCR